MVFTTLNPARESYMLWRRFRMPNLHGSRDAVAVSAKSGDQLLSAYTFLLEHIVLLVWVLAVVAVLFVSNKIHQYNHPHQKLHSDIWIRRTSPYGILKLALKSFLKPTSSRWWIVFWVIMALSFVVVKYAVPIIFAPYIKIGTAAPVRPSAIFVPSYVDATDDTKLLQIYDLVVPSALRAAGAVDGANDTVKRNPPVRIDKPVVLGTLASGDDVIRIDYRYNITGLDFGLQNFAELVLYVDGSCTTDYTWYKTFSNGKFQGLPGAFVEQYGVFGSDADKNQKIVSLYDGGPPIAYFYAGLEDPNLASNSTWAAIVSSVNRTSFTESADPWYRTGSNQNIIYLENPDPDAASFMVMPKRPALSCWENDVWAFRGHNSSLNNLGSVPGLNLPDGLRIILSDSFSPPMIVTLGTFLRVSGLKSSFTALSDTFDAKSSSIYADLERLVFASYIASVNVFTETTLYPTGSNVTNDLLENGKLQDGAADFVIFSNDVATLSVRALIIIPTIALTLWIIFLVLMILPMVSKMIARLSEEKKEAENENVNAQKVNEPEAEEGRGEKIIGKIVDQALSDDGNGDQTIP